MKKILFLFALLPAIAFGQSTINFSKKGSGTGDLSKSDSTTVFVTPSQLSDSLAGVSAAGAVMLKDSVNYASSYMSRYDGVTGLALKLNKADSALMAGGYTSYADGIAGLALKANIASPTFTGTVGGITATMVSLGNVTNKAQVELEDSALMAGGYTSYADGIAGLALKLNKADSVNYTGGYMSRYDGVTGDAGKVAKADSGVYAGGYVTPTDLDERLEDTVALETIITLQSDTVPQFVFLGGGGNAGDTTMFTTSTVYGSYRVHDTTIITSINAVMIAGTTPLGTDTLGIQIYFNDSINVTTGGSVRLLNAATLGINSVTTGTVDASFANNTIYPGERVFMKSPGVVTGRKPIYVECTIYGYIQNRAY